MNKIVGSIIITILVASLGWSLNEILLGINHDLKLKLNIVLVDFTAIMISLLLAGLSFIWVWWVASEGQFGN